MSSKGKIPNWVIGLAAGIVGGLLAAWVYRTYWMEKKDPKHHRRLEETNSGLSSDSTNPSASGGTKKVITLFRLEGCGPCISFYPTWKDITSHPLNADIVFQEYESKEIPQKFLSSGIIQGFPTMVKEHNGKMTKFDGSRSMENIMKWMHGEVA
jgi:hypothetical protein